MGTNRVVLRRVSRAQRDRHGDKRPRDNPRHRDLSRAPIPANSGITSSMGLNKALGEKLRHVGRLRSTRFQDSHQGKRMPELLRAAPRREHRLPRCSDERRWRPSSGLRAVHRRRIYRRSGTRWESSTSPRYRQTSRRSFGDDHRSLQSEPQRRRRVQQVRRPSRRSSLTRTCSRPWKAEIGPLDRETHQHLHGLGQDRLYKLERGEGECAV